MYVCVCVCVCVCVQQGFSPASNPYYQTRQRFQKLYVDFRVEYTFWRMVLMGRKLLLVLTAIIFNQHPMFQVLRALPLLSSLAPDGAIETHRDYPCLPLPVSVPF